MTPFTINSATEPDAPILLAMIRELAEFERLMHELEVAAISLCAALFGKRPVAAAHERPRNLQPREHESEGSRVKLISIIRSQREELGRGRTSALPLAKWAGQSCCSAHSFPVTTD